MSEISFQNKKNVQVFNNVSAYPVIGVPTLGPNDNFLVVYKKETVTISELCGSENKKTESNVSYGITTSKLLKEFMENPTADGIVSGESGVELCLIAKQDRELLSKIKPRSEQFFKILQTTVDVDKNIYEKCSKGDLGEFCLVFYDYATDYVYDVDGTMIPVAIAFDYMGSNGQMNDERYELDLVVKHLRMSKQIEFVQPSDRRPQVFNGFNKNGQVFSEIYNIPGYNATSECSLHVPFLFFPTKFQLQELFPQGYNLKTTEFGVVSNKAKHPTDDPRRIMFETDMLGLRAIGASKYTDY